MPESTGNYYRVAQISVENEFINKKKSMQEVILEIDKNLWMNFWNSMLCANKTTKLFELYKSHLIIHRYPYG